MKRFPTSQTLCVAFLLALFLVPAAWAGDALTIAAGAGYKELVKSLSEAFAGESGVTPQQIFGNMGQITAQAEQSGVVDLVIGDKSYLDNTKLPFAGEQLIGKGKLILAVAKGVELKGLADITSVTKDNAAAILGDAAITRIALPDKKKAIYGRAATQFLESVGLADAVASKLLMVGTVPQVSAYVVSGEVDLGFVNLTDALVIEPKAAKILPVEEDLYKPIRIVAKPLEGSPNADMVAKFVTFLQSDKATAIATRQGL